MLLLICFSQKNVIYCSHQNYGFLNLDRPETVKATLKIWRLVSALLHTTLSLLWV
jgi:hypothetical protein